MKRSEKKKIISMIAMLVIMSTLLIACASGNNQKATAKQGGDATEVAKDEVIAEPTPEPTPTPTPTPFPYPEIDDRYEYHLYDTDLAGTGKDLDKPVIGINLPEGWVFPSSDRLGNDIHQSIDVHDPNPPYGNASIECSKKWGSYGAYWGDGEFMYGRGELLEMNKGATIATPFGDAEIYYVQFANTAYDIDTYYSGISYSDDIVYESGGKRYFIIEKEVAVITIGDVHATFEYGYGNYDGLRGGYEGKLESIIPLLLEPKAN